MRYAFVGRMAKIDLTGKKFGKLIVLYEADKEYNFTQYNGKTIWTCECECKNLKNFKFSNLKKGLAISCGCLQKEKAKIQASILNIMNTKYSPHIAAARIVWDRYNELSFEDYYELATKNCFYCESAPIKTEYSFVDRSKEEDAFLYNGIDRVDSKLTHTKENCVTACVICNRGKRERTQEDTYKWFNKIIKEKAYNKNFQEHRNQLVIYNIRTFKNSLIKSEHSGYDDGNLTKEQFCKLSQLNCFYCDSGFSNTYKKRKIIFNYNGLDRVDNTQKHDYDNSVTCCKWCNWAKSTLSLKDWFDWIKKIEIKYEVK